MSTAACGTSGSKARSSALSQESYVDSKLLTWSITPRVNIKNDMFGFRSNILTGLDYYDSKYDSDRSQFQGLSPIHVYNLTQRSIGGYWQQTVSFTPTTDFLLRRPRAGRQHHRARPL